MADDLPQEGQTWVRKRDGVEVDVVTGPRHRWDFIRLRWPDGRTTDKRLHYFVMEFKEATDDS